MNPSVSSVLQRPLDNPMNQFPALDANNLLDKQTPRLRLTLVEKGVCLYGPDNVALQALAPGNFV
jgi:hypothetical protein